MRLEVVDYLAGVGAVAFSCGPAMWFAFEGVFGGGRYDGDDGGDVGLARGAAVGKGLCWQTGDRNGTGDALSNRCR